MVNPPLFRPRFCGRHSRLKAQWSIRSIPLHSGPGVAISVDYFGPLPTTPRGNACILLFTDRFSRRADIYAFTDAKVRAEGANDILVNEYTPLEDYSTSILSDNGL